MKNKIAKLLNRIAPLSVGAVGIAYIITAGLLHLLQFYPTVMIYYYVVMCMFYVNYKICHKIIGKIRNNKLEKVIK